MHRNDKKERNYKFKDIAKIFDESYQDKPVFYDYSKDRQITYKQIFEDIYRLSERIKAKFSQSKGSNVLLFLDSGFNFVIGFYAVLFSGNAPILVNNKLKGTLHSLETLFDYVLTDEKNRKHIEKYLKVDSDRLLLLNGDDEDKTNTQLQYTERTVSGNDKMLYLFTSGSTGKPKLIEKTYSNIIIEVEFLKDLLHTDKQDLYLPLVPTFHIYGLLFSVLLPIYTGGSIRLDMPFSPSGIIEDGLIRNSNIVVGNPTQYISVSKFFGEYEKRDFKHIKYCISSTMAIDSEIIIKFYKEAGIKIIELYGSTETGGIAYRKYYDSPYWKVFPYIEYQINSDYDKSDAESNQDDGNDNIGILELDSPTLSKQKSDNGEKWFSTGDVVELNDNDAKSFTLLGRVNQIIKTGGNRVSAIEVENVIKKGSLVKDIVVIGVRTKDIRGEVVVAYVELSKNESSESATIRNIKEYCQERLPDFKIPKTFVVLPNIPRGANGKVLYNKLPSVVD
jgi:acyl-coenzyme A synthetase/AMP-(fatty) acid ligase